MITLYGSSQSRASRCLWTLEELKLQYEHVPMNFTTDVQQPWYREINPGARIPALNDNGRIVLESIAINLYLAQRYSHEDFWKPDLEFQAKTLQWSFWAVTEVEPHNVSIFLNTMFLPEPRRSALAVEEAKLRLQRSFAILEGALRDRDYLISNEFTIGDLNVAAILGNKDFAEYPFAQRWLQRCIERESYRKVKAMA